MRELLEQYEIAGQDNWRITELNQYGEGDSHLFPSLGDALVFIKNNIVEGISATDMELAFIVPFTAHVTIEI